MTCYLHSSGYPKRQSSLPLPMNDNMWANPVTQENVAKLKEARLHVCGVPDMEGLASGKTGLGRDWTELDEIYGITLQVLGKKKGDLAHKNMVVTAGGTQEAVDPGYACFDQPFNRPRWAMPLPKLPATEGLL